MDALSRIIAIVREEVGGEAKIGRETLAAETPGWNSGAMVNILFAVEEAFGLTLTSAQMEQVRGVPDLLSLVATAPLAPTA